MRIEQRKRYWVVLDNEQVWLVTKNKNIATWFMKKIKKNKKSG